MSLYNFVEFLQEWLNNGKFPTKQTWNTIVKFILDITVFVSSTVKNASYFKMTSLNCDHNDISNILAQLSCRLM